MSKGHWLVQHLVWITLVSTILLTAIMIWLTWLLFRDLWDLVISIPELPIAVILSVIAFLAGLLQLYQVAREIQRRANRPVDPEDLDSPAGKTWE